MLQHRQIPIHRQAPCKKIRDHYLKKPACQFACLLDLWWSPSHCLTMFPKVHMSHSPSIGTAQNGSQASVWLPQHSGVWAMASHISYFLLSFGRNSMLDRQYLQKCFCSTVLLGLLTLLLATDLVEGNHHVFLICLILLIILLSFLVHCWGSLCSPAQPLMAYRIFGIQLPVCSPTCHCIWC